ncbi:hypothetical protein H5V45_08505 [Nocardioides sp. KIGAM211]|uniref:Uncharacterized protein n=1 Tax=Nocardioides luti TaxID=2761101 RepID=A0A7X0VA46_9ACTN|nr:hypothetical protein [Nocardioides luti]MBB6627359.1 hypothetical protein [Nocardioides luti]
MVALDRSFVVDESQVWPSARASFVAWHHRSRPWRSYLLYVLAGLAGLTVVEPLWAAVGVLAAVGIDVVTRFQRILHAVRTQEPVGTTIALGFGDDAFAYRTWVEAREVPYAAVRRIVRVGDVVVIDALEAHIFWSLPAAVVTPADRAAMLRRPG